eukprot:7186477-Prymnesium_polylepis.1
MSTHSNVLFIASKTPMQSALNGANTTSPLLAVAAPLNGIQGEALTASLIVTTQANVLLVTLNVPTQSAWCGANTTSPLLAIAAPENLSYGGQVDMLPETSMHPYVLFVVLNVPTQLACLGAKMARPSTKATPSNLRGIRALQLALQDRMALSIPTVMPSHCITAGDTRAMVQPWRI